MCDRARDRPSRNACNDTFSMSRKGPRKRWSSFFEVRVVLMFHESSQTVSLTLNWGIIRHRNAEWTLYCWKPREIWSQRSRCSSLRSVATWWSFGWKPLLLKNEVTMVAECEVLLYANSAR